MKSMFNAILSLLLMWSTMAMAAFSDNAIRVGVITDLSGPYSDMAGWGVEVAARMAIEDFGEHIDGKPIELLVADNQSKPDRAVIIARQWIDTRGVDVFVDVTGSAAALALQNLARDRSRVVLFSGAATNQLSNEECSPVGIQWTFDTTALANGTAKAMVERGGKTWFLLTADYAFGQSLEKEVRRVVEADGGNVIGSLRHPLGVTDFSSFLLQAQVSKAQIIGLANASSDTVVAIKQAKGMGIPEEGQQLVALTAFITDVHSLGLGEAQGLLLTTSYYWDRDDASRAWGKRFFERHKKMPTMIQAGVYSALSHYFKAVRAIGGDEAKTVVAKMRELPIHDFFARNGILREDGLMVHDMLLVQVKTPDESKYPWDYYRIVKEISGARAYAPLESSRCPLLNKP